MPAGYRPATPPVASHEPAGRRLRFGYVAATFREHCQSFFTVPLLANHDHRQFEIFAYSDTVAQDVRDAPPERLLRRMAISRGFATPMSPN